ncbi:helix-turn-helix domain-containing protein [Psychroflexus sp. MBR-150]|jgi:excisionase family DNA binding protein
MQEQKLIQLLNVTPNELKESIINDVRTELKTITQNLHKKEPEEYLTRNELADIFKVTLPTISDWSKKGILKPYRLGKLVRFKRSEVEQALTLINPKNQ